MTTESNEVQNENQETQTEAQQTQEKPVQPDLSGEFVKLKREQRMMRAERAKMEQAAKDSQADLHNKIKSNPIETLRELGVSTEALTSGLLNNPIEEPSAEQKMQKDIQEMRAWQKQQEEMRQKQEQDQLIADFKGKAFSLLDADVDKYKVTLNHPEGKNLYWKSIEKYTQETGAIPSAEDQAEIAAATEKILKAQYEQLHALLGTAKADSSIPAKEEAKQLETTEQATEEPTPTLSHSLSGGFKLKPRSKEPSHVGGSNASKFTNFQQQRLNDVFAKFSK
jgi:hypothetical protein